VFCLPRTGFGFELRLRHTPSAGVASAGCRWRVPRTRDSRRERAGELNRNPILAGGGRAVWLWCERRR
jgi:hypothetical protein